MGQHIYIHIPFCISKCRYCSFASIAEMTPPEDRYVQSVLKEAGAAKNQDEMIDTLYIGGGTPSLFGVRALGELINGINNIWPLAKDAEITIEANPETISAEKAAHFKALGINRISLGIQTLSDRLLKYLGRPHDAQKAKTAYASLRKHFDNINTDFIYASPKQTMKELDEDLAWIAEARPGHVSAYMFHHEEGTAFAKIASCKEGLGRRMFFSVIDSLEKSGLDQYEISNFSSKGKISRHNMAYWMYEPYKGLGAAAVSCEGSTRKKNISDPYLYMAAVEKGLSPVEIIDILDKQKMEFERKFLSLRTKIGLPVSELPDIPRHLYRINNGRAVLTPEGMLVSNEIFTLL